MNFEWAKRVSCFLSEPINGLYNFRIMRMLCASRVKTCFLGPSRIKWLGKSSDMSMWNPIMTISQYLWQTSSCFCWGLCSWHHEVWGLFQRAWNGRCRLVNTWPVAMHSMMVMMATSLANWNCDDEMVRPPPKKTWPRTSCTDVSCSYGEPFRAEDSWCPRCFGTLCAPYITAKDRIITCVCISIKRNHPRRPFWL